MVRRHEGSLLRSITRGRTTSPSSSSSASASRLKPGLPPELAENMSLSLDSVLDLLRVARNEAGHPTGRKVDRGEAYINLQMFARYLETLVGFRSFFGGEVRAASAPGSPR